MLPLPILRMLGTPPPCPLHWSWRDLAELPPADENHRRGEDEYRDLSGKLVQPTLDDLETIFKGL